MKLIAFYLPQFHPIKENNEWWGKGFTEWRNVTKSKALFKEHYQPQLPSDLGFYDLRVPEVMEEQSKMAKEYGIDAFCYYHYWFNGKLLLEQPLEQMLQNKKVNISFCLSWANENWTRRWDGRESEILMEQKYEKYDSKSHLKWLIPFFKDERYLKIDNKPVFLVYRAMDIKNISEIIKEWDKMCKEAGLKGIYTIASNTLYNKLSYKELLDLGFDAVNNFEPNSFYEEDLIETSSIKTSVYDYKKFSLRSIEKEWERDIKIFPTVFPNWDNSPRKGEGAIIIQNENVNDYAYWLYKSMEKVNHLNEEEQIVFINAWNEWAEGAHLEPDLKFEKLFLEATKFTKSNFENGEFIPKNYKYKISDEFQELKIDIDRPIFIWGTGSRGLRTFRKFPAEVNFIGFIDSNINKRDELLEGYKIYNWQLDIEKILKMNPMVLIASSYEKDIIEQIKKTNRFPEKSITNMLRVRVVNKNNLEIY